MDDDEFLEVLEHWNFDECDRCVNRFKPNTCADCGVGEHFEEVDQEGVDDVFRSSLND
jgi:hypothetical protein